MPDKKEYEKMWEELEPKGEFTAINVDDDTGELDVENISLADLSTKTRNSLPDAAFALVYTIKRGDKSIKVRKYPHHYKTVKNGNDNSTVNKNLLRAALKYIAMPRNQRVLTPSQLSKVRSHLNMHAKALKIGENAE